MPFQLTEFAPRLGDDAAISEWPGALAVSAPLFELYAEVSCTVDDGDRFTIGFIEAIVEHSLVCQYDGGTAEWEIPGVADGPVSVARGHWPWCGDHPQRRRVSGPALSQIVSLARSESERLVVPWAAPLPGRSQATLERVSGMQRRRCWLVARDDHSRELEVLRVVDRQIELSVRVDPASPLSNRCALEARERERLETRDDPAPVPPSVLEGPSAPERQLLRWYPDRGPSLVVVAPALRVEAPLAR